MSLPRLLPALALLAATATATAAFNVPLLPPTVTWPEESVPVAQGCAAPATLSDCAPAPAQ